MFIPLLVLMSNYWSNNGNILQGFIRRVIKLLCKNKMAGMEKVFSLFMLNPELKILAKGIANRFSA